MLDNAARAIQGALCGVVRETFHWIDSTLVAIRQSEEFPLIVLLRVLSDAITRVSDVSLSISIVNFFLSKDSFDTELLTPNMKRARTVGGACPRVMQIGIRRSSPPNQCAPGGLELSPTGESACILPAVGFPASLLIGESLLCHLFSKESLSLGSIRSAASLVPPPHQSERPCQ